MYKNYDYCNLKMAEESDNILKYNQGEKSIKIPLVTYKDTESLLERIHTCKNNPEKKHQQPKLARIKRVAIHYLPIVRLILQKVILIAIEVKDA